MNRKNILFLLVVILLFALVQEILAIPAFARRNKISCSTCHVPFPKLNDYGDEFAGNGFIVKEDEKKRDYIVAGDDLLWLNKDFPLAVRFDAYAMYDQDKAVENDLQSPYGLKLLSGGTLYKNIGYYFYFYMSERGDVAGVEDAYVHFDNVFGSNLDIMVGQFQTSDPLMKRELRMTFEDYQFYKYKPALSRANLTYDRGVMLVYGIDKSGTDIIATISNGNGIHEADNDRKFDDDIKKSLGFKVAQGIGEHLSIGAFYYQGNEENITSAVTAENKLEYWGPDINIVVGPLEFTGQYLKRTDTNPFFAMDPKTYTAEGLIGELIYAPKLDQSRVYYTLLYNKIDSELAPYQTFTTSFTYLLSRNLRLLGEYTYDLENEKNRFTFGLITAY